MLSFRNFFLITVTSLFFVTTGYTDTLKYASRTIENGTKVQLIIGNTVLPAVLNDSVTSQDLLSRLPYTLKLQRYSHGYCGGIGEILQYRDDDLHSGWLNGDIVYSTNSKEIALLYRDEEISKDLYDGLITLGIVTTPLSTLENLDRSLSVTITLE